MQPELIDLVGDADQLGVVLVVTVVVRVRPVLVLSHQVSSKTRASLDKTFRTHNFQQIFPFLAKINKLIAKFDILTICNNFLESLLSKIAVTRNNVVDILPDSF